MTTTRLPAIMPRARPNLRRGVVLRTQAIYSADFATQGAQNAALTNLKAQWCYNYLPTPDFPVPAGVQFIPMMYTDVQCTPANLAAASAFGTILGFNEPNAGFPSANMTVAQALAAWPLLEATGCRLGAPACVNPLTDPWLDNFVNGVGGPPGYKPRIDFFPLHYYANSAQFATPAAATTQLISQALGVSLKYQKPCWFTEMGAIDFNPGPYPNWSFPSAAQAQAIIAAFETACAQAGYLRLERYCWYPCALRASYNFPPPGGPVTTTPAGFFNTALTDLAGTLTAQGTVYAGTGFQP